MLAFYGARLVSYFLEMGFMILTVDILHLKMHIMKIIAQVLYLQSIICLANWLYLERNSFVKSIDCIV